MKKGTGSSVRMQSSVSRSTRRIERDTEDSILTLREVDFLAQVTQLAEMRHWLWVHFRPAQTLKGWRTPVQGPLGKGWPDLLLIRPKDGRRLAVELKRDKAPDPTVEQWACLDALAQCGIPAFVWRPRDWPEIEETLR